MKGPQTNDIQSERGSLFPFWRRGLVVLTIAAVAGPLLGALAIPLVEAFLDIVTGRTPTFANALRNFQAALGLTLIVGVPFALVAGLIMGWIVAKSGTIGYGTSALIAFLVPCVLSLPILGGLFVFAPFIGLAAAIITLAMRALVGWIAIRFAGITL
ncbi:hypothetical protein ABFT80_21020 [Mesorhizobium sp. SB112]|uniref:hypothetical protein n=1 Tax=Mesorhizobium sp. SB112 TaxID=3151853 RepID=UPI0032679E69